MFDPKKYPADWKTVIRPAILERAQNCCEGSDAYPECRARNYEPHPETGSKVILTIAHLDHNITNSDPENLRAWCQRCHLLYDLAHHQRHAKETRRAKKHIEAQLFLFQKGA